MTPSVRMLELLSILQDGRELTGASSAERLDASSRTVRRDLDRLRELGYPVESRRGPGGAYRLVAGSALPPLLFTDDEAVAAVVGLRLVGEAGEGALRKLERVLPSRLADRVRAVSASVESVSRAVVPPHRKTPGACFPRAALEGLGWTTPSAPGVRCPSGIHQLTVNPRPDVG